MRSRLVLSERGIEVVAQFACPARRITQTYNFLIDTGSSASYLGWEDAYESWDQGRGAPKLVETHIWLRGCSRRETPQGPIFPPCPFRGQHAGNSRAS